MQLKEMRSAWRMLRWAGLRASRNASVGSAEDLHCNLPIRYARPCEGRAHIIQRLSVLMGPGADLDYPQMYSKPTGDRRQCLEGGVESAIISDVEMRETHSQSKWRECLKGVSTPSEHNNIYVA